MLRLGSDSLGFERKRKAMLDLEGEMKAVRRVVEQVARQLGQWNPEPRRYTLKQAAKALSISLSRLRVKIRRVEVITIRDGGKLFVPREEIIRLCTPVEPKKRARGRPRLRSVEPMTAEQMHRAIRKT